MAFQDLTPDEQALVSNFVDSLLRQHSGLLQRWVNDGGTLDAQWNSDVGPLVQSLDGADEIPNGSNLDGSSVLTANDVTNLMATIQGIETNYNTVGHEQTRVRAAGPNFINGS